MTDYCPIVLTPETYPHHGYDHAVVDEYHQFQQFLSLDPEQGVIIPGCGGVRKIRWRDLRRGKGRRGGLRIIYFELPEAERIFLIDVYDKNEAADLTPQEKKLLTMTAKLIREAFRRRTGRKGRNEA